MSGALPLVNFVGILKPFGLGPNPSQQVSHLGGRHTHVWLSEPNGVLASDH